MARFYTMRLFKAAAAVSALALVAIFAVSCGKNEDFKRKQYPLPEDAEISSCKPGKYGGIFVLAMSQEPKTFNPLISSDVYSSQIISMMLSPLVTYDPIKEEVVPALAKSWDISPDGKTYTFHLRRGVKFSDGADFTADDVIFTFDAIFAPKLGADGKPVIDPATGKPLLQNPSRYAGQYTIGGEYTAGEVVNIDAGSRSNYRFDGWTSSKGGSFADASSASTTFTMPAADTTITAAWSYIGGGGSTTDYYRLTFETNGGSEISSIRRAEYTTIDLTDYTPTREGYEFTGWYADENLTEKITSIRLTRNTTVYAGWEEIKENPSTGFENPFTDVSESDWFFNDVKFVYQNGLMNGTSATTFSPEGTTSRGMIVTILWRMAGSPDMEDKIWGYPFADVDPMWTPRPITAQRSTGRG